MRTDQRRAENIAPLASWIGANALTDVLPDQRPLLEVELRGLERLTFLLRRHGVDLIRRERGVIEVQVAAAGASWLQRGGTPGAHG
jgi:hypothetical protein